MNRNNNKLCIATRIVVKFIKKNLIGVSDNLESFEMRNRRPSKSCKIIQTGNLELVSLFFNFLYGFAIRDSVLSNWFSTKMNENQASS